MVVEAEGRGQCCRTWASMRRTRRSRCALVAGS